MFDVVLPLSPKNVCARLLSVAPACVFNVIFVMLLQSDPLTFSRLEYLNLFNQVARQSLGDGWVVKTSGAVS